MAAPTSQFQNMFCFFIATYKVNMWASQVMLLVKNQPANAEDMRDKGSIPGLGRSPGGGHGNPLQ